MESASGVETGDGCYFVVRVTFHLDEGRKGKGQRVKAD